MNRFILYHNSAIFYTVHGSGSPVMLIHGFAEDSSIWSKQVNILQQTHLLIIPDLAGSGRSGLFKKEHAGLEDHAEAMRQILIAEKIARCAMIGHSMGGYITLAFADKYPGMLSSLVLFHSSAYADDAEKIAARKKGIGFMQSNGSAAFLKASIPGLFSDPEASSKDIDELMQTSNAFASEALVQCYEAMIARPDRTHVLRNFSKPVGFIIGRNDQAIPFRLSMQQTHMPQISYIYILRNSAHMGMLEETEKANSILSFLLQHN